MNPELINQLFEIVIIPLLGALTIYAVKWINAKTKKLSVFNKIEQGSFEVCELFSI